MSSQLQFAHIDVKPASNPARPIIESVRLEWIVDETPEFFFLTDSDPDYIAQDQKRLRAYDRGEWWMTGCVAFAMVSTPCGSGSRRLQEFQSGGLWGIASDESPEDKRSFEAGQLHDLRDHLESYGVDTANLWILAGIPEDHATL